MSWTAPSNVNLTWLIVHPRYTTHDPSPAKSDDDFTESVLPAVLGAIFGSLTVIAVVAICWCYRRRKHRNAHRQASRRATTDFLAPEFGTVEPFVAVTPIHTPQTFDQQPVSYAAVPVASSGTPTPNRMSLDFACSTPLPTSPQQEFPFPHTPSMARMSLGRLPNEYPYQESPDSRGLSINGGSQHPRPPAPAHSSFTSDRNSHTLYENQVKRASVYSGHGPESANGSNFRQSSSFPDSSSRRYLDEKKSQRDVLEIAASSSRSGKSSTGNYINEKRLQSEALKAPPVYTTS